MRRVAIIFFELEVVKDFMQKIVMTRHFIISLFKNYLKVATVSYINGIVEVKIFFVEKYCELKQQLNEANSNSYNFRTYPLHSNTRM